MYKVLLVDDEPPALEGLKLVVDWERLGYQICGACDNGEEAAELIEQTVPDLVITDIRMPGLDGLDLIKRVRERMTNIPKFIIISGYGEFDYARQALRFGIKHYLLKPVFSEELTEVLASLAMPEPSLATATGHSLAEPPAEAALMASPSTALGQSIGAEPSAEAALMSSPSTDFGQSTMRASSGLVEVKLAKESPSSRAQSMASSTIALEQSSITIGASSSSGEMTSSPSTALVGEHSLRAELVRDEINHRDSGSLYDEIAYLNTIVEALEDINLERLETAIEEAFTYFAAIQPLPEILKMYLINIIYHSIGLINEMNGAPAELLGKYNLNRLDETKATLQEMKHILKSYCAECCAYLKSLKDRDSQINIYKVEEYLRENFKRNLTIKEIAKNFYMHPAYVGQLFMKKFGCSFNEYLHKMRIEAAKRLMDDSGLKTHEIAMEVGYNNYHGFLQNFEKYVGVKPAEYKNRVLGRHC
jgi:two-component system response regulator YesN